MTPYYHTPRGHIHSDSFVADFGANKTKFSSKRCFFGEKRIKFC